MCLLLMLSELPTNTIVTRWPRCATFYIERSYFVFITLSCQILFAMNKCIWCFELVIKIENWNATQIVLFIHQNSFLLLKCIQIDLGKINYYLTRQGDEDKIRYLYIKGATSWSSCNYGISGKFRQHWLKTNRRLWYKNNVTVFQIPEKLVKSGPRPKNMNKPIKKQSI
jgi:hypothetical protein